MYHALYRTVLLFDIYVVYLVKKIYVDYTPN